MKLGKVLLPLAMLFTLPLAGCEFNVAGSGYSGDNSGQKDDGESAVKLSAESEAIRIASEIYEIDPSEVVIENFEDEDAEADVYKYSGTGLTFYYTGMYDEALSYDDAKDLALSFIEDYKKDTKNSYGEEEDDGYYYFDFYYTNSELTADVVINSMDDGTMIEFYIFKTSQLSKFEEFFEDDDEDSGEYSFSEAVLDVGDHIAGNLGNKLDSTEDDGDGTYCVYAIWGTSSTSLMTAMNGAIACLPSSFEEYEEPYEDEDELGEFVGASYIDEDQMIFIEMYSYVYDSDTLVDFYVYEFEWTD